MSYVPDYSKLEDKSSPYYYGPDATYKPTTTPKRAPRAKVQYELDENGLPVAVKTAATPQAPKTPAPSGSSGGRDRTAPTPGNIPQFGTQMGSRVTIDSMKEYLDDRGLSADLRNPFSSNQLPNTTEHSKALSGTETPQAGDQEAMKGKQELQGGGLVKPVETEKAPQLKLSEISRMFLNSNDDRKSNIQAARQAQAMRGTFAKDNRYFMNAPKTEDGLVEITREQFSRVNDSSDAAQDVLDEQIEFGGLVEEQKNKFAGKSVAEVNAAYSAMSDEDKKKYGMAMHAAHFGKFNTPEIKTPAASQNPVKLQGFEEPLIEGVNTGQITYNSTPGSDIMQEQTKTIGFDLKGLPQDSEKPLSQNFLDSFKKNLFG